VNTREIKKMAGVLGSSGLEAHILEGLCNKIIWELEFKTLKVNVFLDALNKSSRFRWKYNEDNELEYYD
jgi:hypothetical protein